MHVVSHQSCMACVASFLYNYHFNVQKYLCFIPSEGLKGSICFLISSPPLSFPFSPPPFLSYVLLYHYHSPFCAPLCDPCLLLSFSSSSPHPDVSGPHGSVSAAGLHRHHRQRGGHEVHEGGRQQPRHQNPHRCDRRSSLPARRWDFCPLLLMLCLLCNPRIYCGVSRNQRI